jgi:membrane-associated phospholipid phosphatase
VGADLIDAQIVNGVLTTGLKVAVDRTRPNGGHRSFPSGHTSSTFATAAVIQRDLGWRAALPVYALGAYVGTSRVVDRAHFVSDVLFGTAVGLVSGRAVTVGHGRAQVSVSAVPLRGGAALTLTMH